MHKENRYKQLVFYLEACESGSMFRNILPDDIDVFATTAADYDELAYMWYYDKKRKTYLGCEYSINWMEDTDAQNIQNETVQEQFDVVKKKTTLSHPQEYGDLSIGKLVVGEFQGKQNPTPFNAEASHERGVPTWDAPLDVLYRQLEDASESEKSTLQHEIETILKGRSVLETIINRIASRVALSHQQFERLTQIRPPSLTNLQCHSDLITAFETRCFQFSQHPYALKFAYVFANICEQGLSANKTIEAMNQVCNGLIISGRID